MKKDNTQKERKLIFRPWILWSIAAFENMLSKMEADGWALYKVRLGILFCFARCKPQDNVVYYVICEEGQKTYATREPWTYGKKSLVENIDYRFCKKHKYLSFDLDWWPHSEDLLAFLRYDIYRFSQRYCDDIAKIRVGRKPRTFHYVLKLAAVWWIFIMTQMGLLVCLRLVLT